ncbi:MAG: PipX family protein [Cyanobacteria bacterium P01_G01_bin.54]
MQGQETYLNHPTFGLLFRICPVDKGQELFTTLYAQRLFFVVVQGTIGFNFEPLGRSEARLIVENRLRQLRRAGASKDYQDLNQIYKQTF